MEESQKRSSDSENVSTSPKRPRVMAQSQPLTNRKVLSGIPCPSPSGRISSSQGSRHRKTTTPPNDLAKTNEVAELLQNAMRKARRTQPEPDLDQQIEANITEETSGIIKSVRLYNFMCHKKFEYEFHPNLNFITGENGSGKSAVLSGILVGLGAKALTTARTKSIKNLVKTGENFAKIEIELINRGLLDSDKYSEIITIERLIDSKGPTSYRIRSFGKWRTLRKTELDYILMTLGIQLDNPVAILNQETARSFLRSKDPRDKYKLFYEGTLLKSCDDLLKDSKMNIEASRENFERTKEVINAQNIEIRRLQKLMQKIAEVDDMKKQVNTLEVEGAWARVNVSEQTVESCKKKVEEKSQKIKKLEDGQGKLLQDKQELIDEASPTNSQKEELKKKLQLKQSEYENVRREWQTLQKALTEQKTALRAGKPQEEKLKHKVQVMERNIEKMRKNSQEEADERRREVAEKKEEMEAERAQLVLEVNTLKADGQQFRNGADACRAEVVNLDREMQGLNRQITRLKDELRDLSQNRVNKYTAFGPQMETLIAKIKAHQNSFRKPPRGPFASCFTVKDKKWAPVIEHVLGGSLLTFIVDNSEDSTLLNRLITQVYETRDSMGGGGRDSMGGGGSRRPSVFLMEFGPGAYDISRGKATMRNHPTILDMLKVENDDYVVTNALCDMVKAERILLFESKLVALDVLKDSNAPGFPRTCIAGFSLDFFKITPDPHFRADARNRPNGPVRYLRTDTFNKAMSLKEEITALENQAKQLRPSIDAKRKEEAALRAEFSRRDEKRSNLQRKCHQLDMEIQSLLAKTSSRVPDVNNYIEELNDMQNELRGVVEANEAAQEFINDKKTKVEELTARKSEAEGEVQEIQENISKFEGSKDLLKGKIEKLNTGLQKFVNLIRQAKADKEVIEKDVQEAEQELQSRLAAAEALGEKVESNRTPTDVKHELAACQAKIAEAEKHLGDKRKIAHELKETRNKYESFQADFKVWYSLYLTLIGTIKSQDKQFQKSVTTITTSLQTFFKGLIAYRGYQGTLTIDNTRKELFYFVCPDGEASSRIAKVMSTNDTKLIKNFLAEYGMGLSGGECSFSTICFIVSMWQAMQCPFFMLDEFDVFMDAFNRKASQNALISHARRYTGRQFFLLSPLELTERPDKDAAKILMLYPPDRTDKNASRQAAEEEDSDGDDSTPEAASAAPKRQRRA